jgi:hypothetical protein
MLVLVEQPRPVYKKVNESRAALKHCFVAVGEFLREFLTVPHRATGAEAVDNQNEKGYSL